MDCVTPRGDVGRYCIGVRCRRRHEAVGRCGVREGLIGGAVGELCGVGGAVVDEWSGGGGGGRTEAGVLDGRQHAR